MAEFFHRPTIGGGEFATTTNPDAAGPICIRLDGEINAARRLRRVTALTPSWRR